MVFALYLIVSIFLVLRQSSAQLRPLKFGCLQEDPLKFGCDTYRSVFDHICCTVPMGGAEKAGFLKTVDFFGQLEKKYGNTPSEIVFFDSQCGIPLYVAPRGRTYAKWKQESLSHSWPSFRSAEVVLGNINVKLDEHGDEKGWGGELVSKCNTHLGHRFFGGRNLPESVHTRDCVNLICMSGSPLESFNGTGSLNLTPLKSNVKTARAASVAGAPNVGAFNTAGASDVAATSQGSQSGSSAKGLRNHTQALKSYVSSAGAGASNAVASRAAGASIVGTPYEVSAAAGSGGSLSNYTKTLKSSVSLSGVGAPNVARASETGGSGGGGLSNRPPLSQSLPCPAGFNQVKQKDAVATCKQDWRGKVASITQCQRDCEYLYGSGGLFSLWRVSDWNYVGEVACQCWQGDCKIVNAYVHSSGKQKPLLSGSNACTLPTERTKALVSSAGGCALALPILLVFSIFL